MTWKFRTALLVTLFGVLLSGTARAQVPAAPASPDALRAEMMAVHKSVDELVALFKLFNDGFTKQNRATLLLRRIELAERQIASADADLKAARAELKTQQDLIARATGQIDSLRTMQAQDRAGNATSVFEAGLAASTRAGQEAQAAALDVQNRVSQLEQDVAARRSTLVTLEALVDQDLGL